MSTAKFNFVGKIIKPKDDKFYSEKEFNSGWINRSLRFTVVCGNDRQTVKVSGGCWKDNDEKNEIQTFTASRGDNKGEQITIAWADRFNSEAISKVAYYKRYLVDLREKDADGNDIGDKYEYLSSYDFTEAVKDFLADETNYKDRLFNITGTIDFSYDADKNKYYRDFIVTGISLAEPDKEPSSTGILDIYFGGEFCLKEIEDTNKTILCARTPYYDRSVKGNLYAPIDILLDTTDEKQRNFVGMVNMFTSNEPESVFTVPADIHFVNGASKQEITREQAETFITKYDEVMIQFGQYTREDKIAQIIKEKSAYGVTVTENRYIGAHSNKSVVPVEGMELDDLKAKSIKEKSEGEAPATPKKPKNETPAPAPAPKKTEEKTEEEAIDIFADDSDDI